MTPLSSSLPVSQQLEHSKTLKLPAKLEVKHFIEAEQFGLRDSKYQKQDCSPNIIEEIFALTFNYTKGVDYAYKKK